MLVVHLIRPNFSYQWILASVGVLIAWPMILLSRLGGPQVIPLIVWQPESLSPTSPGLLLDDISWSYSLAIVTLGLAVILTAVARLRQVTWRAWAGDLTLTGLGLLAVLSGNPLTLLLGWATLDLAELVILLGQVYESSVRGRIVIAFSARIGGIIMLIIACMVAWANGETLTFSSIPPVSSLFLILAAGLRLGVLPLHLPFLQEPPLRRGLGTISRLIPAAASLILLTRTATVGIQGIYTPFLIVLTALTAFFGSAIWAASRDELSGRQFWILGIASLSVVAAIEAKPDASLAWGIACILSGGLLFLTSLRHRWLIPLGIIGMVNFSGLPFTPAWDGTQIYQISNSSAGYSNTLIIIANIIFLISLSLLMVGYVRQILRDIEPQTDVERWVWLIYPAGLIALPLTHWLLGLSFLPEIRDVSIAGWVSGGIAFVLAIIIRIIGGRSPRLQQIRDIPWLTTFWGKLFSLDWFYQFIWILYRSFGRIISFISGIMEGEGGVLWALILLILMFELLFSQ
jgi:hypothetical protein